MEINSNISSINRIIGTYQSAKVNQTDIKAAINPQENSNNSDLNNIEDKAEISQASKDLLQQDKTDKTNDDNKIDNEQDYTPEENNKISELKRTDAEVKAHEQAHSAAAGDVATSGPSYEYEEGPDGKKYAVSGEVNIQVSEQQDPEKAIEKAERAKRAALAPAEPSSQDRSVANQAEQLIQRAKAELQKNQNNGDAYSSLGLLADVVA